MDTNRVCYWSIQLWEAVPIGSIDNRYVHLIRCTYHHDAGTYYFLLLIKLIILLLKGGQYFLSAFEDALLPPVLFSAVFAVLAACYKYGKSERVFGGNYTITPPLFHYRLVQHTARSIDDMQCAIECQVCKTSTNTD
jgi:hypothetical protein